MGRLVLFDEGFDRGLFARAHVAFGVFDGFHRGHRLLVGSTAETARREGGKSVVLTFDRDPDELFRPDKLRKLMTNERRLTTLTGEVDAVVVLPFTRELASLDPETFLHETFDAFAPASLHVGEDFRFGSRASGTVDDLLLWSKHTCTHIVSYRLEEYRGATVTATRIRKLLGECQVGEATRLLGHPYTLEGTVVPGRQEGREMGFATANLSVPAQFQTLGSGVYAAYGILDRVRYKAAVSVGASPTFAEASAPCEVHLLDFEGDLYGRRLEVEFVEFLRPMVKFDSIDELVAAVNANIDWCRKHLAV